jgi:hypothetical protein
MIDRNALREAILARLSTVIDPETGVDVMQMRLIEDLAVDERGVPREGHRGPDARRLWACRGSNHRHC